MPNIGFVYALSAGANSILILDQSASSSSASSIGSAVVTPWPISERSTRTSTLSSAPMRSHALGDSGPTASRRPDGRWNGITRATPAEPATCRNSRRETADEVLMSRLLCRAMDRGADALVGPAAADVRHRRVDVSVGRTCSVGQQGGRGHDLARLAVAALGHVFGDPCALYAVRRSRRQAFDGGDALGADGGDRRHARARCDAVQVDGAGAALCDAASELRASQAERVAQDPQERCVGGEVDAVALTVDGEREGRHGTTLTRRLLKG